MDKPRDIKAKVLPYDECDCDDLLWALNKSGFIRRYSEPLQPGGEKVDLIWVDRFVKHQHIHANEPHSELPEFKEESIRLRTNPNLSSKVPPILNAERLNDECGRLNAAKNEKPKKESKRAKPLTTIAEYFGDTPHVADDFANDASRNYGWPQERIEAAFRAFLDHHASNGKRFADWRAAFRTWCRNEVKFESRNSSKTGGRLPDKAASAVGSVAFGRYGPRPQSDSLGGVSGTAEAPAYGSRDGDLPI